MSNSTVEQRAASLQKATAARSAIREVRLELTAGVIALAEALEDPRAGACYVHALLNGIRRVGPHTTRRVMFRAGVPELKRVRDLTPRQRAALVSWLSQEVNGCAELN